MSTNAREFTAGIREYVEEKTPEQVRDIRDAAALEGIRTLINLTPVDTGRLRGNWQTTVGEPATGAIAVTDPTGARTFSAAAATIASARDPFKPIWFHNGVEYGPYVNDGTDKVPAVRMVEQTAFRLNRVFGGAL